MKCGKLLWLLLASQTSGVFSAVFPELEFGYLSIQAEQQKQASFLEANRNSPGEGGDSRSGRIGKGGGKVAEGQPGSALDAPDIFEPKTFPISSTGYPGLMFGIFCFLVAALTVACLKMSAADEEQENDDICEDSEDGINPEKWTQLIEQGELEIYTCMALDIGAKKTMRSVKRWIPKISIPVCTQITLGVLLIAYNISMYESHELAYVPYVQSVSTRLLGCLLFLYSSWMLYESMLDDCREDILRFVLLKHVSGWYSWPIYFGETINTFLAVTLIVVLYLIFNDCTHPRDLLVNCLAINFAGEIDNHIVSEYDKKEAIKNLAIFNDRLHGSVSQPELMRRSLPNSWHLSDAFRATPSRRAPAPAEVDEVRSSQSPMYILQATILLLNRITRMCIPLMVIALAFLFLFANNVKLCNYMRELDPWPFCYGTHYG